MKRRALLVAGGASLFAGSAGWLWLQGPPAPIANLPDWKALDAWLDRLADSNASTTTGWGLPQVLHHLAQSIEYSIEGYPEMKPPWFRKSLGALAGRAFQRAGSMRHGLDEPIPGAPPLPESSLSQAIDRLRQASRAFAVHQGPLHPHFAYGRLDHAEYTRAHLMHVADHARLVRCAES